jgi:hypothetical protein
MDKGSDMELTADTARQILTIHGTSIERKKLRLMNFMAAYGEDAAVFDKYSLTVLNTYIKSLRDQVSHMETNWNTVRGDGSCGNRPVIRASANFSRGDPGSGRYVLHQSGKDSGPTKEPDQWLDHANIRHDSRGAS